MITDGVLTIDKQGIPSNADKSSRLSIDIATGIAKQLWSSMHEQEKAVGQTSGAMFEQINMEFLAETFPRLQTLRPGKWNIANLGN